MRKILSLLAVLVLSSVLAYAQTRKISGVVKDEQGVPIPFSSVRIKGSSTGASADQEGKFTINADSKATLVVSAAGYEPIEVAVGASGDIAATLKSTGNLSEVVVTTALGISKAKRSLGYSTQSVVGEELNKIRPTDISAALAGKVSGLQSLGTPSSNFGEGNVRIRGAASLTGANPIYVVDGTVVSLSAVNMDDVENISVLKGPSATALYGVRGAGGVIMITTKKGSKKAPTVTVNSLTEVGEVYLLPKYQNEYGGGYSQDWQTFKFNAAVHPASWAAFDGQKLVEYGADESWGPRMDGTPVREWFSWYAGDDFGKETPFSPHPNSVKDFYETSLRLNNNIVFEGGSQIASFRLSYNNRVFTLPMPNTNKTDHILSFKGMINVTPKFTVSTNVNFLSVKQKGTQSEGYASDNASNFNQWWQRQLDMKKLKDYKTATGGYKTWNIRSPIDTRPAYWNNPYFEVYESYPREWSNRIYGDLTLSYKILNDLKASIIFRANVLNYGSDDRTGSFGLDLDYYGITNGQVGEYNQEFLLEYKKRFGKFGVEQYVGGNLRQDFRRENSANTVGGLSVPNLYSITASKDRPTVGNRWNEYKLNSIYARGTFDYNNLIFIDYSLRNDVSSSLPASVNGYIYPSVSASFVFSDLIKNASINSILSFGKLRGAFGRVGSDLDPYTLNLSYGLGTPYGSNPTMGVPTTIYDQNIKPSLSKEYEVGTELQFFNNRIGIDFSLYRKDGIDQIIPLSVTPSSGAASVYINAGLIRSEGWDLIVNTTPIKNKDFKWDITFNIASNNSKVLDLDTARGLTTYNLGTASFGPAVHSRVNESWGTFIGTRLKIDPKSGKPIVNAAGEYQTETSQKLGSVLPDWTGGMLTTFSYRDFSISATLSVQKGGNFWSLTRVWQLYSGLGAETVGLNDKGNPIRDDVASGGGVRVDGVLADGTPVTVYRDAQTYFGSLQPIHALHLREATFVKLTEARISYNIPVKNFSKVVKSASVSLFARNPWLIYAPGKDWGIDPSELENDKSFYENGQNPSVRSFGLNLSVGF
jgi:TonB-linked SusC/RagA family outer membrane protein